MNTHRGRMSSALRVGMGAALLCTGVLLSRAAGADAGDSAALSEADTFSSMGYCSASGQTWTGRQNAMVQVSPRDPNICVRIKLGGVADSSMPDCWKVAYSLGCSEVVDLN